MNAPLRFRALRGGLQLEERKAAALAQPIAPAPLAAQLVLPLQQHQGAPAVPVVQAGEYVFKGQTLATADGWLSAPVHASTSGTVLGVEQRPVPGLPGGSGPCLLLAPDGLDAPLPQPEWPPVDNVEHADPAELHARIQRAGIVGLGGAVFPTAAKLGVRQPLTTLILNGAECEPYISCDQSLLQERAEEILVGAQVLLHVTGAGRCHVALEDNKTAALAAVAQALQRLADPRLVLSPVPALYPSGSEKQLVRQLTGRKLPPATRPVDLGIVVVNVATAWSVSRAIRHAEPLIRRIVTVTGAGVRNPRNLEARLGTPASVLIAAAGGYAAGAASLIMGGPMMGIPLASDEVPVTKAMNCLLVGHADAHAGQGEERPCIRCGACAEVCPEDLLPQQLYWFSRGGDLERARGHDLFDCIECGCCSQVCPSHIPLVQYYRQAKTQLRSEEEQRRKAEMARARHEARQRRLQREAEAREEARRRRKQQLSAVPPPGSEGPTSK